MITEVGHFALALAAVLSIFLAVVPVAGVVARNGRLAAMAPPAGVALMLLVAAAFAALVNAYVGSDFSVMNVADNSHTAKGGEERCASPPLVLRRHAAAAAGERPPDRRHRHLHARGSEGQRHRLPPAPDVGAAHNHREQPSRRRAR